MRGRERMRKKCYIVDGIREFYITLTDKPIYTFIYVYKSYGVFTIFTLIKETKWSMRQLRYVTYLNYHVIGLLFGLKIVHNLPDRIDHLP